MSQQNEREEQAREKRIQWFREAKFGLFIHWGLYCIPAGEWQGEEVAGIGEWIMRRARIPVREYEKLAGQFNPARFDAEQWTDMAVAAGMKYIVITAKHHDGFAMYRSAVSPYNVADATPFRRDVIGELAAACRRKGLRFGVYYSQAQDWHEPGGAGNDWDFPPNEEKDFDGYLSEKALPQVEELLTGYGPICLVWFDTPVLMNEERSRPFVDLIRRLQPDCLIDGRLGMDGDYQSTGDNKIPPTAMAGDWETPATLNDTWGYKKNDHNWKSPEDLIFKLVDIVSKGGNYLLNVGPDAQGLIPAPSAENLKAVGEWLKVNGEAVYGAGRTCFGAEFGEPTGETDPKGIPVYHAKKAWRCTTKAGKIYLHVFDWPEDGQFRADGVTVPIRRVSCLADAGGKDVAFTQQGTSLTILLKEVRRDPRGTVLRLETAETL